MTAERAPTPEASLQKRNFGQAKRAKENARKERQQKKLERRQARKDEAGAASDLPAEGVEQGEAVDTTDTAQPGSAEKAAS